MALTPAPTMGSPGIDQFSPAQVLRTARLFASDPALPSLVDPDEKESLWVELDSSPHLQIWLLSWPTGTHNEWRGHGESVGAFQVVSGTLLEQTSIGHRRRFRTLIAGEAGPSSRTTVTTANVQGGTALSVNVYAPRLATPARYGITPTGWQAMAVGKNGLG